ncbi:FAD-dependent oxidoreductase [Ramlibacter sp.]|uniref:FAD-dependent oxidoreductase n=1 Tax=Ramlibacter sp. TaxID=1917967 RepID=UPI003D0B021B
MSSNDTDVDVLVVGGSPGGCSAAISAARSGRSVLLIEATPTLGGMNANGTFGFDCGENESLSGIAEEVGERIRAYYRRIGHADPLHAKRGDLVWESRVAAQVWRELASETKGLEVRTRAVAVGASTEGGAIREVQWQAASDAMGNVAREGPTHRVRAKVVIDATYEADVVEWSGAPYRLGREARSPQEPHAGRIFFSNHKSAPADGYLPHSILRGSTGEGDDRIMAFACRLHCRLYDDTSTTAAHRLKQPPPGYDASVYEWAPVGADASGKPIYFDTLYVLVNGKYLLNRMVKGNNLVGPNREYILAHPRDRKDLRQRFVDRALGYLWFIQNEGGMPELGLAHDEFADNGNLPYQIFVREGRRIEGRATLTESDVNPYLAGDGVRPPFKPDAVAIADWTYESQGCADAAPPGLPYPDGYITGRFSRAAYQIPYGCLLPREGADNLLVVGGIGATHIAFGATRVEAARIQMGIAAGIAAALAVQRGVPPALVPVGDVQAEIVRRKGKLVFLRDVASSHPRFEAIQWAAIRGWVPDDDDRCFRPDDAMRWCDLVEAVVRVLQLPASVTSVHFDGMTPRDPWFRAAETLYDLGTRADVDLFGIRRLADEDPMQEFLRLFPKSKLLPFHAQRPVTPQQGTRFIRDAIEAWTGKDVAAALVQPDRFTRADACTVLRQGWMAAHAGEGASAATGGH